MFVLNVTFNAKHFNYFKPPLNLNLSGLRIDKLVFLRNNNHKCQLLLPSFERKNTDCFTTQAKYW